MNKKILVLIIMFVCTVYSYSREKYPKPKANEVVIITRFSTNASFHDYFFSQYFDIPSYALRRSRTPVPQEDRVTTANLYYTTKFLRSYSSNVPLRDDIFLALRLGIPDNRTYILDNAEIYPADFYQFRVILPFNFEITIPEGVNYVYLGTFHYEMEGIQYDIESVTLIDEFEKAEAFVKEKYGEDAELVRIPVTPVESE